MRFLAFLLGIILNDIWITIAAFSLASAFCYFLFIIYANYVVGNSFFNLFRFLLNNFLIAILVAFPILFTTNFLLDKINILLPFSLLVSCTILIVHYWRLFSLAYK